MASQNIFPNTFLNWKDCIHLTQFYFLGDKQRKPYAQFYPMEDIAHKKLPIFFMAFKLKSCLKSIPIHVDLELLRIFN